MRRAGQPRQSCPAPIQAHATSTPTRLVQLRMARVSWSPREDTGAGRGLSPGPPSGTGSHALVDAQHSS
jgi:hypothetical protein